MNEKRLCPDCLLNYLESDSEIHSGLCSSCSRRKNIMNVTGKEYKKFKDLSEEEKSKVLKDRINLSKGRPKTVVKNTKNLIYTASMIDVIKDMANDNITVRDLMEKTKSIYPDKNINMGNFVNIITRHNIPHKSRSKKDKSEEVIVNNITEEKLENNNYDNIQQNVLNYEKYLQKEDLTDEERLKPIEEEVTTVLYNKFKKDNCYNEIPYTTEDYIKMLEMLLNINEQKNTIVRNGVAQHRIMDLYEDDIVHETENILLPKGNTYLQDKLHVLRNKRRALEYNGGDISIMREFLNTIDMNALKNTIKNLKQEKENRVNFKYIPNVDETMIDKYNWCLATRENNYKALEPVVIPYVTSTSNNKAPKQLNTYRVSCQLSGAGFGAFKSYYKDYQAISQDIALSYGEQELEKMKKEKPGILIQNINIHKIN